MLIFSRFEPNDAYKKNAYKKKRVINPRKPEIGRISKKVLQKINLAVRTSTGHTQWRNTPEVIKWFENLKNKTP